MQTERKQQTLAKQVKEAKRSVLRTKEKGKERKKSNKEKIPFFLGHELMMRREIRIETEGSFYFNACQTETRLEITSKHFYNVGTPLECSFLTFQGLFFNTHNSS